MSDWQVGDLAVCVDVDFHDCGGKLHCPRTLVLGRSYEVAQVIPADCGRCLGLILAGGNRAIAQRFRKIRPDEQSGEIEDWNLLLETHKRKVEAKALLEGEGDE